MKNNLPATKEDLQKALALLETKLVTKMVTKEDAKQFATKNELAQTERILRAEIRLSVESVKVELREDMKHMESRIIDHLDSFLAEVKASSEEREIVSYRLSDHEERLTKLETNLAIPTQV